MRNPLRLILLVSLAVVLGGCAATQPPSYYLLEPAPGAVDPDGGRQHCMTIGLCPVRIPAYIDRPQIMVRTGKNELAISEFDLWAEPLREGMARAIARNLESMTCADVANVLPAGRSMPADYLLNVRVDRLEGRPGGEGSSGLGLAICKGIVESLFEGKIQADHSPLGGLRITITLPTTSQSKTRGST